VLLSVATGRIMRQRRLFGVEVWLWSVMWRAMVQAGPESSGEADSVEAARHEFRQAFDRWLAWATVHQGEVRWFG
jgi:hypothetical protein